MHITLDRRTQELVIVYEDMRVVETSNKTIIESVEMTARIAFNSIKENRVTSRVEYPSSSSPGKEPKC
jgi:hypothetical protein